MFKRGFIRILLITVSVLGTARLAAIDLNSSITCQSDFSDQTTIQLDESWSNRQISILVYRGGMPELDNTVSNSRLSNEAKLVAGLIKRGSVLIKRNGPVIAMVSTTGIPHKTLATLVPSDAEILGGTRFFCENGSIIGLINSLTFKDLDGIAAVNNYFRIRF